MSFDPSSSSTDLPSDDLIQIIKASYALQQRVGKGPFDSTIILKCQTTMDTVQVDFPLMAQTWLDALVTGIERSQRTTLSMRDRIDFLARPIMDLKANGRMFRYDLITDLTNIMLSFLEMIPAMDNDVLSIMTAHHQTLQTIIDRRISGAGGQYGQLLRQELKQACGRYCRKHNLPPLLISMA